jgi:Lipid A 3-O-deacylase (PagL)
VRGYLLAVAVVGLLIVWARPARADDPFAQDTIILSGEGGFNHFGPRLQTNGYLQAWNFGARFSLLPFAPFHTGFSLIDGSLETGLEPVYVRFTSQNQNYGGLAIDFRYHLTGLSIGPFVPWINWLGGAGGTDVKVAGLTGPFMFIMQAGAGAEWFVNTRTAVYLGYQYEHFSNGGTEHNNFSLNSPGGAVLGLSFILPR